MTIRGSDIAGMKLNRREAIVGAAGLAFVATGAVARPTLTPIEEARFIPAGGIDQWISVRGQDRRNPVLLVVHGGPGEAQWPQEAHYRSWEKDFTVVQWDQRGAGHTYGRYGAQTTGMTLDQISNDGIDVAMWLCRALGKRRIIVLGHSWGSSVGVTMVQRRPDLFAAYVGTGEVGSWKGGLRVKFDAVLAKARADGDAAAVSQLEAAGPPDPLDADKVFAFNDRVYPLWPQSDRDWVKSLRAGAAALRAADPTNYKDFEDGFRFSAAKVVPDQIRVDLPATANRLGTAAIFIQGRDDMITPTADAVAYFGQLQAPYKKLILIPDAGHFAFMTAPTAFLDALVTQVRPLALRRGA